MGSSLRDLGPPRRLTAASHVRYVLYVGYVRYVGCVTSTNGSRRPVLPTELVLGLSETVKLEKKRSHSPVSHLIYVSPVVQFNTGAVDAWSADLGRLHTVP